MTITQMNGIIPMININHNFTSSGNIKKISWGNIDVLNLKPWFLKQIATLIAKKPTQ